MFYKKFSKPKDDAVEQSSQTAQIFIQTENPMPESGYVFVEGGTFNMGSEEFAPVHSVTLSSFVMCDHPVTQKEYLDVTGNNPSEFKGDEKPVEHVSWYDAVEYCNALSKRKGLTPCYEIDKENKDPQNDCDEDDKKWTVTCNFDADGYRLPTEAEWEYAARGGKACKEYKFSGSDSVDEVAWYEENAQGHLNHLDDEDEEDEYEDFDEDENDDEDDGYGTQPVKTKKPNTLGIYDMSGNVYEWCWDWFGVYDDEPQVNPTGETIPSLDRIARGGSWFWDEGYCTVTYRNITCYPCDPKDDLGFRVVRSIR
ncbi:MAG: SUMF1/EgtB/PvdO family nonheme iron enzyme [Treponema sp.]|nr:SUMF1/EgtB/PvdO family nonheme iron enzyme [Treponema sp.]